MIPDHGLDGICHFGRVNGDQRFLADTVFPDQDLFRLQLLMMLQQAFQNFQREFGSVHRQHQAIRGVHGLQGSVKSGQGTPVGVDVPDSLNVLPAGIVAGNIVFFNAQGLGFAQHMLQKGLSFKEQFCLAGAHPGAFSAGQQKQGILFVSFHSFHLFYTP